MFHVKSSNRWQATKNTYARYQGRWVKTKEVWVRKNGLWEATGPYVLKIPRLKRNGSFFLMGPDRSHLTLHFSRPPHTPGVTVQASYRKWSRNAWSRSRLQRVHQIRVTGSPWFRLGDMAPIQNNNPKSSSSSSTRSLHYVDLMSFYHTAASKVGASSTFFYLR